VKLKFIADCSSILGTIITPSGKLREKMTKKPHMLVKLRENCVVFCTFSVFHSLNFLRVLDSGAWPLVSPSNPPPATPLVLGVDQKC